MRNQPPTTRSPGAGMITAAAILGLALVTWLFGNALDKQQNPNGMAGGSVREGVAEVVLERNRYGHYLTHGLINGERVLFMLDTGASDVAIPYRLASELGLERGPSQMYRTANGMAVGYTTILDRLELGPISLTNVRASILPGSNDDQILLGMTVLKHLEFTQKGDELTLRQYP